jgi:hypothetical protein
VIEPLEVGRLAVAVDESSGLAVASESSLWTHNDRGSGPEIYEIDLQGEILRTVELVGVEPIDMEDMASDRRGHLFIGDFGNNDRDRSSLLVYRVTTDQIGADRVTPEIITFVLPDNGLQSECHYDFEAMIWTQGRLVLFTKDRCDEPDNQLLVYAIPDQPGSYTAEKLAEFDWGNPDRCIKITGADLSWDGKHLALLSREGIHLFHGYENEAFFGASYLFLPVEKSKKEGICYLGACDLYVSEESKKKKAGRLLKIDWCEIDLAP